MFEARTEPGDYQVASGSGASGTMVCMEAGQAKAGQHAGKKADCQSRYRQVPTEVGKRGILKRRAGPCSAVKGGGHVHTTDMCSGPSPIPGLSRRRAWNRVPTFLGFPWIVNAIVGCLHDPGNAVGVRVARALLLSTFSPPLACCPLFHLGPEHRASSGGAKHLLVTPYSVLKQ